MVQKTKKQIKKQTKKQTKKEDLKEEFKVRGHEVIEKVKELVKEGNVRRIIIKDEKGKVFIEIPVTFAVVGAVFAPILAALGALAALVSKCTIEVERK
jgi:C4-type Zn-finger protein